MVFYLALTSMLNIGLGYALAVYFCQGQWPWQIVLGRKRAAGTETTISQSPDKVATQAAAEDADPKTTSQPDGESLTQSDEEFFPPEALAAVAEPTADESRPAESETPDDVADDKMVSGDDQPPLENELIGVDPQTPNSTSELSEVAPSPVANEDTPPEEKPEPIQQGADSIAELVGESKSSEEDQQEMLRGLEQFRDQLQQEELDGGNEATNEAEPSSEEVNKPDVSAVDADVAETIEEISAPQEISSNQEDVEEPASDSRPTESKSEESAEELAASEATVPEPLDDEKTLAGIEAFRAQLASMQTETNEAELEEKSPAEEPQEAVTGP